MRWVVTKQDRVDRWAAIGKALEQTQVEVKRLEARVAELERCLPSRPSSEAMRNLEAFLDD